MVQNLVRKLSSVALVAAGPLLVVGVTSTPAQADDVRPNGSGDRVLSGGSLANGEDGPASLCHVINDLVTNGQARGSSSFCDGRREPAVGSSRAVSAEDDGVAEGNAAVIDIDAPAPAPAPVAVESNSASPECTPCAPTTTSTSTTSTTSTSTTSSTSSTSTSVPPPPPPELPATGSDIGMEAPLGAGLVLGGGLCVWASRRRLARLGSLGRYS
jgi:LPXTG-motif cell wall-anchored protein